ncbi:hypothetical protein GLOIN_2v1881534 [Rhizophagus irregularis DAOM 181602=DAOM 197198]|uniref:Phosphatidylglycerol/phosphatidylinositol transfer protein n=1 Tax=Rhizophagus irregularis (strain DAOM 181602 / DAOM 197198 / MUCL 43194) TaxID=747089 RepID=A0A2P4PFQ5_RHIID|nr:hypothetical protein GLOIN_2v1881534 [Rhizophagus irregularis DAOM 181602=DAOM 197198]POG64212.1 hypothetical protein GLOIN_2v1881534 [Rhizophagus irregularis DAOM 181602=DAOM 197198]|eukprot:XP_025171078.1 hypothetical protein GLOIN_2v1881534 [Rhizophagus irregularis DAOM 181602=DAOM 197198]
MNRNFIFAFVLLAILSTVYALPFELDGLNGINPPLCPVNAEHLTLTVSPSPIVSGSPFTLNVSGKLNSEVPQNVLFNAAFLKTDTFEILGTFSDDICSSPGITCPIPAGTDFSTTIEKVAPAGLPASFVVGAVIVAQGGTTIACTFIEVSPNPIVHGSSFTFNVSGKLNSEIPTDFCASPGISCPISAGTEFSTGIHKTAPDLSHL